MSDDPFSELRVLIVDDQRTMRMIVRDLLSKISITDVEEAENGVDALEKLQNPSFAPPDLVICDLHMDKMDGMQLVNMVRRNKVPRLAGIPIIILTGDKDSFMHEVSSQAGATKVLTKPISAPDLRAEIAAVIGFG